MPLPSPEPSPDATGTFRSSTHLVQLCDAFVRAWRSGQRPRIEDHLCAVPESVRTELLTELICEEIALRRQAGEQVTAEEYLSRFPQHQETVARAFDPTDSARSLASTFGVARSRLEDMQDTASYATPTSTSTVLPTDRYRKIRELGHGAFGTVWLAEDVELRRQVALKEPRAERLRSAADIETYLSEARVLASLDHPHIVPVHDVGRTADGSCYVVSKLIDGADLDEYAKQKRLSFDQVAHLVAQVADALQHTHNRGLVHRDIKPANILIDSHGRPYVTDFGLALREEDFGKQQGIAGTPAYMSPEQARGEGHLIDGRSDIFSLGVVLYELLVGTKPFHGANWQEILEQITTVEAKPLRQRNQAIPKELERICLKALSKRAADRYPCAADLVEDLRRWSAPPASGLQPSATAKIVPKGLRSFDAADSDFFLELLPGPCDRDGLPETLRFWKTRIEETDPDKTFRVGLVYGPSGCGKSSLMKAGLLPRLADHVIRVFLEATPDQTEAQLLQGLRRACADLPRNASLVDTLSAIRRGKGIPAGRKIVLVLDQFEQWLYAHSAEHNTELAAALRQCDGQRIQAVLLVRDDFWMPATRFLDDLEVRLIQGQNAGAVDLFDPQHARKVLAEFGKAYGCLPENLGQLSPAQKAFLDQAGSGLAQDGKVICVRLALFADMMKGRIWTPAALQEVGGTAGAGAAFLEETFNSRTAPPQHRQHQEAVRAVLCALLPGTGTEIKGHVRTASELRDACGYAHRPQDFAELMRILDSEVRLITPVTSECQEPAYQLTHDYLVPSLRDWLTWKQRETMRGRAELLLAERAATWAMYPSQRHLPAWHEDLRIRLLTKRAGRTDVHRRMLRASGVLHATRWGVGLCVALAIGLSGERFVASQRLDSNRKRVASLVDAVSTAPPDAVPFASENLRPLRELATPLLRERVGDRSKPPAQRLNAALTLADYGECNVGAIVEGVSLAADGQCGQILKALAASPDLAVRTLDERFAAIAPSDVVTRARLAILALHFGSSERAVEMCALAADPTPKRLFEETLAVWHGNLGELLQIVDRLGNGPLRASVALGIGRATSRGVPETGSSVITTALTRWFTESPDTCTHGAADWALRQWLVALPRIEPSASTRTGRDWYVNSLGQTMLKIPPSKFRMGEFHRAHDVELTKAYFLADREVSVGEFQQFMDDPETPATEKPERWSGHHKDTSPTAAHPVQQVSWYDAVLFCNWLSRREQRGVCYVREEKQDAWILVPHAKGYRLPTEAEWECACRAGTTTAFSFGDDAELLKDFGVVDSLSAAACGSKIPNARGLFDLHGNVDEWCQDWFGDSGVDAVTDPMGDKVGSHRVRRGGNFAFQPNYCRSAHRPHGPPTGHSAILGFRLALSPSGVSVPAEQGEGKKVEPAGEGTEERRGAATTVP